MQFIWSLLEHSWIYRLVQATTGASLVRAYKRLLNSHLALTGTETVLDVGCGTGEYCTVIQAKEYIGLDINPGYIERATRRYGAARKVRFICSDLGHLTALGISMDCAYTVAVTHHLTDDEVRTLVHNVTQLVRDRFVIVDQCLPPLWRNPIGHLMIKLDRGRYGRTKDALVALVQTTGYQIHKISEDFGFPCPAVGITIGTQGAKEPPEADAAVQERNPS